MSEYNSEAPVEMIVCMKFPSAHAAVMVAAGMTNAARTQINMRAWLETGTVALLCPEVYNEAAAVMIQIRDAIMGELDQQAAAGRKGK